ncbi:MAG TPA: YIP1 family protein, partial [Verrucomicrobiae bacterium]|nr:YIP1 family protein [Verrucomicrobiae bacterium]
MVKLLLLVVYPRRAWEKIVLAQKSMAYVFFVFLLPVLAVSLAVELAGVVHWGKRLGLMRVLTNFPLQTIWRYGAAQFLASLITVFLGARLIRAVAITFHNRTTYAQCFTVAAYGLGPFFAVRMFDAFSAVNPWLTFAVGAFLFAEAFYHGIPVVMKPDPPQAFGIYFMSSLWLFMIAGLLRLV